MKKIIAFILSIVIFGSSLPFKTNAASPDTAKAYISACLLNYRAAIDLSGYKKAEDLSLRRVTEMWYDIIKNDVRFFHVEGGFTYNYSKTGDFAVLANIKYSVQKKNYRESLLEIKSALSTAKSVVRDSMTDIEKALAIHDFLVLRTAYDETVNKFGVRDVLVDRRAVCEGYATVYRFLLNMVGIECELVRSVSMGHVWNLVKINRRWYHVDVTWDDPVPDTPGAVSHRNFLLNDEEIEATGHRDWDSGGLSSNSGSFGDAYWKSAGSGIISLGEYDYYSRKSGDYFQIVRRNRRTTVTSVIKTIGKSELGEQLPYLPIALFDGKIYYALTNSIRSIGTGGAGDALYKTANISNITGMSLENNKLCVNLAGHSGAYQLTINN